MHRPLSTNVFDIQRYKYFANHAKCGSASVAEAFGKASNQNKRKKKTPLKRFATSQPRPPGFLHAKEMPG
jgi:hypothetical protein